MRKIKDRILLGAISAIIVSIPFQITNALEHKLKISDVPYGYSATKIFMPKSKTDTPAGKGLSVLINFVNASIAGIFITYLLSLTGKDKAIVKGAGVGTMLWILVSGLISKLGLNIQTKKPIVPFIDFIDHIVFGALTSLLITKLGDDRLFPSKSESNQEEIPIIHTGIK